MNPLTDALERNKKKLLFSFAAVFFWGLLAHGYCFFDNSFSHDSLNEMHGAIFGNDLKITSGRIFVPLYRDLLRSDVTIPWFIGILSLVWIALAVFLVLKLFRVESKVTAFLIAGVFTVNISVAATAATYLHDLDCYMFSLLCAVGAVYLWKRYAKGWLLGIFLITVSLGIYQSFVFTAAALVMMLSILELMEGNAFHEVFFRGLKAVGMVLAGSALYYVLLKLSRVLTGIQLSSGDYNSLDTMLELTPALILQLAAGAYADFTSRLLNAYSSYPGILVKGATAVLLLTSFAALGTVLCSKKIGWAEKALLILLSVLLPLVMNLIFVLTRGASHDLMVYSIWLVYLLALLLSDWLAKRYFGKLSQWQRPLCVLLAGMLLYGNVQFANGMYLKKDLEYDSYLSLMTRVTYRMEETDGYVPGQTPVVFVGLPSNRNQVIPGFLEYWNVTGLTSSDTIYAPEPRRFQAYYDYVLNVPIALADGALWLETLRRPDVAVMPQYPAKGSVVLTDGLLIVKLGDVPL